MCVCANDQWTTNILHKMCNHGYFFKDKTTYTATLTQSYAPFKYHFNNTTYYINININRDFEMFSSFCHKSIYNFNQHEISRFWKCLMFCQKSTKKITRMKIWDLVIV